VLKAAHEATRIGTVVQFIADAFRVFNENGQTIVEAIPAPTRGWNSAVTGSCRVCLSTDAPDKPTAVQIDCNGDCTVRSAEVDGKTEYWCECC
jgi:hypothetical protein